MEDRLVPASVAHPDFGPVGSNGGSQYIPSQIATDYSYNASDIGTGTTIAIVDAYSDPNIGTDLATFDALFDLPAANLTVMCQDGAWSPPPANVQWAEEISLDVEWAHAMAPGAAILLVEVDNDLISNLAWGDHFASTQPNVVAVSNSWGVAEFPDEGNGTIASDDPDFTSSQNMVFVAAAGDSGSPAQYPSASPNVLSVGGTSLEVVDGLRFETTWNDANGATTGGGPSEFEPEPSWQSGVVPASMNNNNTSRATPDVSYDADPETGFQIIDSYGEGGLIGIGGTSAGSPQWAAIVADADQALAAAGKPNLTNATLEPVLYSNPPGDLYDITHGSNGTYSAGPGYDLVTGMGTPEVSNLISTLEGMANPTITSTASGDFTLGTTAPTLSDSAVLAGGDNPTGTLVFTLTGPDGFSYSQSDPVTGNGTYSAGTTLPTTGTVVGTYTWHVTYSGDDNNFSTIDRGTSSGERLSTSVDEASPTITSTATTGAITLGTSASTLIDKVVLAGGYYETGNLNFTLTGPDGFNFTQSVPLRGSGNGTYSAFTPLPRTGTVVGTYTWQVSYDGDGNNNSAADQGGAADQTVVSPANPTLTLTASGDITLGITAPTLTLTIVLANSYFPTQELDVTLSGPATEYDGYNLPYNFPITLTGNGTYTVSYTLPISALAGTWTWDVTFSGDSNNIGPGSTEWAEAQTVVSKANPTITSTASSAVTLGATVPTLTDSAVLANGFFPYGILIFTLTGPGGFSYSQSDWVTGTGNGTYTASTTLPTTGAVAGTYTWDATYTPLDGNNNSAADQGGAADQTVVSKASPTLTSTASGAVTLGAGGPPTLTDSAVFAAGYFPTGNLVFTLTGPGGFSYSQSDSVAGTGNGTYTASTILPTTGSVPGTYTWKVTYAGDASNNGPISDQGGVADQTVVSKASPTITSTASPAITLGAGGPPTLTDSAAFAGGYFETGNLVFTLTGPGGFSYSQSDSVTGTGNGTYTASTILPTTGTVPGTYAWKVTYAGDANNNGPISDQGGAADQTVVSKASPTITSTASGAVTLGAGSPPTLTDSAVFAAGYFETGSLVFTLTGPDGFSYSDSVAGTGNGTYSANTTLPTTGTVPGTYTWRVSYAGDANNNPATDQGGAADQTVVSQVQPTLSATAAPPVVDGTKTPMTASATLTGGFYETGTVTFTLFNPSNAPVYTDVVTADGNGDYSTATGTNPGGSVPTAPGLYQWTVTYGGDPNNQAASGSAGEYSVGPGAELIDTTLYVVGGTSTADFVRVMPAGPSTTGSPGVTVTGQINGGAESGYFPSTIALIDLVGFGGNETFQESPTITIPTRVTAGNGNVTVLLGDGNCAVTLGNGTDNVDGGNGNDVVTLGTGNDVVTLGNGHNVMVLGTAGGPVGKQNDTVALGGGDNTVTANNGNDVVLAGNGNNTVTLGNGSDNVTLGNGSNTVTLGGGTDKVRLGSGTGNKVTITGNGRDTVKVGNGDNNTVTVAGNGRDAVTIGSGSGNVVSVSGTGNDTVTVAAGATGDSVTAQGSGNNTINLGTGSSDVYELVGTGTDTVFGGSVSNGWIEIFPLVGRYGPKAIHKAARKA